MEIPKPGPLTVQVADDEPRPSKLRHSLPYRVKILSPSSIARWLKCPVQWFFHYIDRKLSRLSGNLIVGIAAHEGVRINFRQKIKTGNDIALDRVISEYSDHFDRKCEEEKGLGVDWGDADQGWFKDSGLVALRAHHNSLTPNIQPVAVEVRRYRMIPDSDFGYQGYVDLIAKDGISDHKFVKKFNSLLYDPVQSLQLSSYAWLCEEENVRVSYEIATFQGKSKSFPATRNPVQLKFFEEKVLIKTAREISLAMDSGNFACRTQGWHCSKKYCGFWDICVGKLQ